MRARVIEVDEKQIYLEVDRQVRFKTPYITSRIGLDPTDSDDVEFRFGKGFVTPTIIIDDVISVSARQPR